MEQIDTEFSLSYSRARAREAARRHHPGRRLNVAQRTLVHDIRESGIPVKVIARKAGLATAGTLFNVMSGRVARLSTASAAAVAAEVGKPHHARILAGLPPLELGDEIRLVAAEVERSWAADPMKEIVVSYEAIAGVNQASTRLPDGSRHVLNVLDPDQQIDESSFAVLVGPGAELAYPAGSYVVCQPAAFRRDSFGDGSRVVIVHTLRADRHEVSVRQIELGPSPRLLPLGEDQDALRLQWPYKGRFAAEVGRITIVGVVAAAIVKEG